MNRRARNRNSYLDWRGPRTDFSTAVHGKPASGGDRFAGRFGTCLYRDACGVGEHGRTEVRVVLQLIGEHVRRVEQRPVQDQQSRSAEAPAAEKQPAETSEAEQPASEKPSRRKKAPAAKPAGGRCHRGRRRHRGHRPAPRRPRRRLWRRPGGGPRPRPGCRGRPVRRRQRRGCAPRSRGRSGSRPASGRRPRRPGPGEANAPDPGSGLGHSTQGDSARFFRLRGDLTGSPSRLPDRRYHDPGGIGHTEHRPAKLGRQAEPPSLRCAT